MNILRAAFLSTLMLCGVAPAHAGGAPGSDPAAAAQAEVLAVVQRFLDALEAADPAAARAAIMPEGQIQVMSETETGTKIGYRLLGDFADRLATWKWHAIERIWNPTVLLQGRLATVWAPYDFHRDGVFSHSGVNVFSLMRIGEEWKIVGLAYTMQPHVPSQHPAGPPKVPLPRPSKESK